MKSRYYSLPCQGLISHGLPSWGISYLAQSSRELSQTIPWTTCVMCDIYTCMLFIYDVTSRQDKTGRNDRWTLWRCPRDMLKPTGPESYIFLLFLKMPNRPKVRLINQNERKISWSVLILEKLTRSHLEKLFSTVTDV